MTPFCGVQAIRTIALIGTVSAVKTATAHIDLCQAATMPGHTRIWIKLMAQSSNSSRRTPCAKNYSNFQLNALGTTWPQTFDRGAQRSKSGRALWKTSAVYPTHCIEAHVCWMESYASFIHSRLENATILHLWNSVLTKISIILNNTPPAGRYFEEMLVDRYELAETSDDLRDEFFNKIRYVLDWRPKNRTLDEEKMGFDWQRIYPAKA